MKPIFIDNSKVPIWVSKITGMNITAVSFAFWVWSKGTLSEVTRRHETIHFRQQLELLFILHWVLYAIFWVVGMVLYRNNKKSYRNNPFEVEAYENQMWDNYLKIRPHYHWLAFMWWRQQE